MLEYTHPCYIFTCPRSLGLQLVIEQTETNNPTKPIFFTSSTVYGSKVYIMKDGKPSGLVSTLPITSPNTPNVKSSLVDTLTSHYIVIKSGAFKASNYECEELGALINNMLSWLGTERVRLNGKGFRIPFSNGEWEVELPVGLSKTQTRVLVGYKESGKHAFTAPKNGEVKNITDEELTVEYQDGTTEVIDVSNLFTDVEPSQEFKASDILAFDSLHFHRNCNNKQELLFNGPGTHTVQLFRANIGHNKYKTILEVLTNKPEHIFGEWGGIKASYIQMSDEANPLTAVDVVDIINGQNKLEIE